jgi:hypothetical protein
MRPMTKAVLEAGLITPNMLNEMKRFSPTLERDAKLEEPKELELAAKIVADALESSEHTLVRETDLDILRTYLDTHTEGTLHFEDVGLKEPLDFTVTYSVTKTGEYVIAWKDESIDDALTNGVTCLRTGVGDVFFKDVRELWYGNKKAFMVCIPQD